tara:strand:- start:390 stop:1643 length:1254 start_codon:yes stop_codon:yes gene_type:complete
MKNKVVVGKDLESSNRETLERLKKFLVSIDEKQFSLVTDNHVYNLGWLDAFRLFLDACQDNPTSFQKLIITSLNYLNRTSPFCIPLYLKVVTGQHTLDVSKVSPKRISSKDLLKELRKFDDEFVRNHSKDLYSALLKAGATGTVTIEPHHDLDTALDVEVGLRTLCTINDFFVGKIESCEIPQCRVLVVDGAIIDVSEIHHLLEHAYETKENICLIASSFSEDVSNTLLVNWEKGNTNIFPFLIRDSIESLNEVKDICSVLGIVPVSKDSGLRVSNVEIEECPARNITYDKHKDSLKIVLEENDLEPLRMLRKKIQEKYNNENVEDVKVLLSKRLSKMSSRKVVVKSKFSSSERGILEDRTGAFFTYFSRCAKQGVTKDPSKTVTYLPAFDAVKAVRMATYDRDALKKIKAVLRLDE